MLGHAALVALDARISEEITDLRWHPLTDVMQLISSWWVKSVLLIAVALTFELIVTHHRRAVGVAGLVAASGLAGSFVSGLIKPLVNRPRPPLGHVGITAIGHLPHGASFPSGHATTAFAGAVSLAIAQPALRSYAVGLAVLVSISRVYLGMHYFGDVVAGALLGAAIGAALTLTVTRLTPQITQLQ